MSRFLYSVLFLLALPLILARLLWRGRRAPSYRRRIAERLALRLPRPAGAGIWLHAVSVGESIAAAPLIRALQERYPGVPITVTCMTPTGSERIRALFGDGVRHCYLPYDLPCLARRFLDGVRPQLAIIMETELWPNFIHQAKRRNIPVILANARLSERSARGYGRFSALTASMLAELALIAAQTPAEAERFRRLGASPQRLRVTGSIKFDVAVDPHLLERARAQRQAWGAGRRPVWIAASTHQGEDEIILAAHRKLLLAFPDALLILVPRHPERFAKAYGLCREQGLACVRRSTAEPVNAGCSVLLGDSMGELLFLYGLADCAFVGGSLVPRGGHNPLEPAALGKPVICGPHLFNFQDIAGQLERAGALWKVEDGESLAQAVATLWRDKDCARRMAEGGDQVLKANRGALRLLLELIAERLPER